MTVARVTQQYIEAAVAPETRNALVTQQYIEAAVATENRAARVTQQYIEAACLIVIPSLTTPLDTATGVSRPVTLTWGAVPGALKYQIQIATDVAFLDVVVDDQTAATSYTTSGDLEAGTTYYWRVRARLA